MTNQADTKRGQLSSHRLLKKPLLVTFTRHYTHTHTPIYVIFLSFCHAPTLLFLNPSPISLHLTHYHLKTPSMAAAAFALALLLFSFTPIPSSNSSFFSLSLSQQHGFRSTMFFTFLYTYLNFVKCRC